MLANIWKFYFEDDVESFRQSLANATFYPSTPSKGAHGGKGPHTGTVGSPGTSLATPVALTSKGKKGSNLPSPGLSTSSKPALGYFTRADLNWKDANGVTLLHTIASCTNETAPQFAHALLQTPLLDLYLQDTESGWTALHRALYSGNVTIARALMSRDGNFASDPISVGTANNVLGLIKIKDREGNSPFDVYGASIASRNIRQSWATALLPGTSEDEEHDMVAGVSSDDGVEGTRSREIMPSVNLNGDEVFTFGSNKNFTLGFGDEDDRQYPERVFLKRPDHLLHRFVDEYQTRSSESECSDPSRPTPVRTSSAIPALIRHRPIIIQDVQLSKLHSAVLTTDPEANLYICGFGPGGRIGIGDETTRFHFVCIHGGGLTNKKVNHVGLGQNHTVAVSSHGEVFTWGNNSFGQLGYASPASKLKEDEPIQLLPRQVFGPIKREIVIGAAASRVHSAIHTATALFTFGKNDGQLGLVDSDARSLAVQITPRKVAASLFSSSISTVSAIDKATVCLLENHDVWIFANYGYTKVSFPLEGPSNRFLKSSYSATRYNHNENHICKISSGGDTICAMSSMGDVYTVKVSQKSHSDAVTSSTTNPTKIRDALSSPQRVWSTRKAHMAVKDVAVGQDGSIILCTDSGSVWRRVKRAKVKDANAPVTAEYKPKDYKFSRVGRLTRVAAVRSSTFGAYAAVRRDCDVLKTQVEIDAKSLWKDFYRLLPFQALGAAEEDSDTEEPTLRFWTPSQQLNSPASICRAVLTASNLEEKVLKLLENSQAFQQSTYDLRIKSSTSDVIIPVHEFVLSGRSDIMRLALVTFRQKYYFSIPEVVTIEYDGEGKTLVTFLGVDFITILNLVLYIYTDAVVDVWCHTKRSPRLASRYRQIRLETMKIAFYLELKALEQAARVMVPPAKILHQDMERAIRQPGYYDTGDVEVELNGDSARVHSALMCERCPFFEGLFNGRAAGLWLSSRREQAREPQEAIKIDLKHVDSSVFELVLRHLYADTDDDLFQDVVAVDFDAFVDLILDVMSVANELMLDRLQQSCQKMLGSFVNTRNVCQLLNAVAPCSVTEFKDAALEYLCMNLEGMLENHLLDELDDDLMLELDEVVRQNQLAHSPIARSGAAEAELFQIYPELPGLIELGKRAKIDSMVSHSRARELDGRYGSFSRGKGISTDDSSSSPVVGHTRPGSSRGRSSASKSPLLKARSSVADLMFEMDEGGVPCDKTSLDQSSSFREASQHHDAGHNQTPPLSIPTNQIWLHSEMTAPAEGEPANLPISKSPLALPDQTKFEVANSPSEIGQTTSRGSKPWGSAPLGSDKLDMKDIMAQASLNRVSNISSGLSHQARKTALAGLPKMSQRARKKQQQQPLPSPEAISPPDKDSQRELDRLISAEEKPKFPWQMNSPGPKVSLKDMLRADNQSSSSSKPAPPARTKSPLTLRQTVPGVSPQRPVSGGERSVSSPSAPQLKENQIPNQHPQRAVSASQPATLASASTPAPIRSIRHYSRPVEPSLQLSMADILSQQQTEKDIFREASAKRSLQEIQEEQAFQEWWDEESRKVKMEEEAKGTGVVEGGRGKGARGRGRGLSRGRGQGRGSGRGKGRGEQSERGAERGRTRGL
ncbi:hypothetical protein MMC07_008188 [Pseudocyphellaria aurata]|nr:hypothetical protein [Pseudocyphellaria aurata]